MSAIIHHKNALLTKQLLKMHNTKRLEKLTRKTSLLININI